MPTQKMGLLVGNGYLGLLFFADTCWIIAMSPGELQAVARAWHELLDSSGLEFDCREAVWCSTAQDRLAASITVSVTVIIRPTREAGSGGSPSMVISRKNWLSVRYQRGGRFYALRQFLLDSDVALKIQVALAHIMCRISHVWLCRKLDF